MSCIFLDLLVVRNANRKTFSVERNTISILVTFPFQILTFSIIYALFISLKRIWKRKCVNISFTTSDKHICVWHKLFAIHITRKKIYIEVFFSTFLLHSKTEIKNNVWEHCKKFENVYKGESTKNNTFLGREKHCTNNYIRYWSYLLSTNNTYLCILYFNISLLANDSELYLKISQYQPNQPATKTHLLEKTILLFYFSLSDYQYYRLL